MTHLATRGLRGFASLERSSGPIFDLSRGSLPFPRNLLGFALHTANHAAVRQRFLRRISLRCDSPQR